MSICDRPSLPPPSWLKAQKGFQTSIKSVSERFKVIVPDTQKEQVRNVGKCIGGGFRFPAMPHLVFFPSSGHAASRSTLVASAPQLSRAMHLGFPTVLTICAAAEQALASWALATSALWLKDCINRELSAAKGMDKLHKAYHIDRQKFLTQLFPNSIVWTTGQSKQCTVLTTPLHQWHGDIMSHCSGQRKQHLWIW